MPPITSQSQAGDRAGCYGCRKREAPDTRAHGHGPAKVRQVLVEEASCLLGNVTTIIEMAHIRYLTGTTVGTVGTTQAPTTLPTTHR